MVNNLSDIAKYDPSRTLTLRNRFAAKMAGKFGRLKTMIRKAVVDLDVFGLNEEPTTLAEITVEEAIATISTRQFAFMRSSQKVDAFMDWLKIAQEKGILEIYMRPGTLRGMEEAWTDVFILTAYQKGIMRARQELRKVGMSIPAFEPSGNVTSYIFNSTIHAERCGLAYARTFNELKGVTDAMDQQISRVLAQGLGEGRGPREIARIMNDRVDKIGITRAKLIARTETSRSHHIANVSEYRAMGIEGVSVVAEWSTRGTMDVCSICAPMEGKIFSLDKIEGMIPAHPNCLIDGQIKIYTSEGWKKIRDIVVGDLVLTHKKRFREVTQIHRTPKQTPDVVNFKFGTSYKQLMKLSVTADHPVFINNQWISAKNIIVGDIIKYLAGKCRRCEKQIPYYKKYCSHSCLSKDITDRQWSDPVHRKNISKKASLQMKREFAFGIRDKDRITKKANEKCRELASQGKHVFQQKRIRDKIRKTTNLHHHNKANSDRMKKNNPMRNPETREKAKNSLIDLYENHPEKRLNTRMARYRKSGRKTYIEQRMADLLDKIGVKYVFQYPILNYNADFVIPKLRIVIECDGEYWHQDKEKDAIRQKRIEEEGWFVLRYSGSMINKCLGDVEDELARVFGNHSGNYDFIEFPITKVEKWKILRSRTLYNLSVDEDESYVANGFVIHNCRCVIIPKLKEEIKESEVIH